MKKNILIVMVILIAVSGKINAQFSLGRFFADQVYAVENAFKGEMTDKSSIESFEKIPVKVTYTYYKDGSLITKKLENATPNIQQANQLFESLYKKVTAKYSSPLEEHDLSKTKVYIWRTPDNVTVVINKGDKTISLTMLRK